MQVSELVSGYLLRLRGPVLALFGFLTRGDFLGALSSVVTSLRRVSFSQRTWSNGRPGQPLCGLWGSGWMLPS